MVQDLCLSKKLLYALVLSCPREPSCRGFVQRRLALAPCVGRVKGLRLPFRSASLFVYYLLCIGKSLLRIQHPAMPFLAQSLFRVYDYIFIVAMGCLSVIVNLSCRARNEVLCYLPLFFQLFALFPVRVNVSV